MQRHLAIETPAIPDKLFYKIGEVSKMAGVEPYVLRYWETEFAFLKPRKSKSGQRIYVKKDLELIFEIKNLLYKERFTIEGVRKKLSEHSMRSEIIHQPQKLVSLAPLPEKPMPEHKLEQQPAVAPKASAKPAHGGHEAVAHIKSRLREILDRLG